MAPLSAFTPVAWSERFGGHRRAPHRVSRRDRSESVLDQSQSVGQTL